MRYENGKCTLLGTGRYIVLISHGGEVTAHELEFPWKYEFDCEREPSDWRAHMQVLSCRARVDGERVGIDAELACAVRTWDKAEISMLDQVQFSEQARTRKGALVVCYPGAQDTLWSVAKRYGSALSSVRRGNGLDDGVPADSPASLQGCKYLIV